MTRSFTGGSGNSQKIGVGRKIRTRRCVQLLRYVYEMLYEIRDRSSRGNAGR